MVQLGSDCLEAIRPDGLAGSSLTLTTKGVIKNVENQSEDRWMTAVHPRGWAKVKTAAGYAGVSPRTFRKWLKDGLRYVKAPSGAILIKLEWIDEYLENFEIKNSNQVDQIVTETLKGLV